MLLQFEEQELMLHIVKSFTLVNENDNSVHFANLGQKPVINCNS